MNRKTFLTTLTAIISAPFALKSKEKEREELLKAYVISEGPRLMSGMKLRKNGKTGITADIDEFMLKNLTSNCNHIYTRENYKCIYCGKDYE